MSSPTIDFSKYESQSAPPQIDFSKYTAAPKQTPEDIAQGASMGPQETGVAASISRFGHRVQDALRGGGRPDAAVEFLGGPVLGPINAAHGAAILPEHPIRGANEVVRGVGQTVALPLAVVNPGLAASAVPAGVVQHGVQHGLTALGVDPDVSEMAGNISVLAGVGAVKKAPQIGKSMAEKLVSPLVRKPVGATLEDARFGRDPAKAITDEGLSGTKQQILKKSQSRVGQISDAVDKTLQNHPNSGAQINAEPIIDEAIDSAVSSAKKTGNKAVVTRLENLREALKTEYGPTKGTPFEINKLKREVGKIGSDLGAFKSTDPLEASAAGAMVDVYSGLKEAVNQQVPEIAPLNERISNLMSAQTALKRNLALQENKSFLSGLSMTNAPFKLLDKTAGSAPVRSWGARALNAGQKLAEPEATPQITGAAAQAKARFEAARASSDSKSNAVQVDDLQGGHAGGGVNSIEEISRPGTNYVVSKSGQLTYHGKSFAPESTPAGASHVTVLPDGQIRVNEGPQLTPAQVFSIRRALPKTMSAKAGN